MRGYACVGARSCKAHASGRRAAVVAVLGFVTLAWAPVFALDGSSSAAPQKIPLKNFTSAQQALRVGLDDLKAGNAQSSVAALTYAADGGQAIARWKLGE